MQPPNGAAEVAVTYLKELPGSESHVIQLPTTADEGGLQRLGLNITSDSQYASRSLSVG
jgi:uncharacterized protein (UPF0371 family)